MTHEYKDAPDVNVTNNYYYIDDDDNGQKANIVIEKPSSKRLVWGIILVMIGVIGTFRTGNSKNSSSYVIVVIALIVIGILLMFFNIRAYKRYNDILKESAKNGRIYIDRHKD